MRKIHHHLTVWVVLAAILLASIPNDTVSAFSITDLLPQANAAGLPTTAGMSAGSSITDMLLGLLFGSYLGNLLNNSSETPGAGASDSNTLVSAKGKELIGFYAEWWGGDTASWSSFSENVAIVDSIAPFWTTLNEDGSLTDRGGNDHSSVVQFAHKNLKSALLLVNNAKETRNGVLPIHTVLRSQDLRSKSIDNLEAYLKKYQMDGINIDFEMVPAEDKIYLTAFMRELSSRLKPQGYIVTIDVFPKQDETNDVAAAYDYAELAKYADKIIIMTYDNHGSWSGPGPIADIRWVENNLKYALQFIPKNKLYLGIAAYGYDWSGSKAESLEHKQLQLLIQQYKAAVRWDEPSKSFSFNYTDTHGQDHHVWFENSESLKYKLDLVIKYNIAGAAMWRLGGEDPASWPIFREKLKYGHRGYRG